MDLLSVRQTVRPVCADICLHSVRWITDSIIMLYDKKIPIVFGYGDFLEPENKLFQWWNYLRHHGFNWLLFELVLQQLYGCFQLLVFAIEGGVRQIVDFNIG